MHREKSVPVRTAHCSVSPLATQPIPAEHGPHAPGWAGSLGLFSVERARNLYLIGRWSPASLLSHRRFSILNAHAPTPTHAYAILPGPWEDVRWVFPGSSAVQ